MRILIVDDNAAMRKVLAAIVASTGHQVVGALEDGNDLESGIRELEPDVICLDYNLPGRDGLSLLKIIQSEWPQIDVIFITGSSESGIEERAADAGASGFIRKPFGQEPVVRELQAVEETRRVANHASPPSAKEEVAGPVATVADKATPRVTAVIADDTGSVRLVLKGLLEECGVQVVQSVANGAEAVQAARNHQPRVVFLDINMPVMGGMEALPRVLEASPASAVVMVTGCADKAMVAQAAGLGAVGYILKPLRPAYVENFMRRLIGA
ncbi:MAG: response regulator [Azonexus sp.]